MLDAMSLSDDDLLDSLADDMLMEMEGERDTTQLASVSIPPPSWSPPPAAVALPAVGPDLSHMMSQMMPMMSQMLGGKTGAGSIFGGRGGGSNSLSQQAPVSWQELVKCHVPSTEQEEWLATIDKDVMKLRAGRASGALEKLHSRSYRLKAAPMPTAYLEVSTMLVEMLNEAVRSAQLEHHEKWHELKKDVVSQLAQTGMVKVFENKVKEMLRQRVVNDPDFVAEKISGRYCSIVDALSV